MPYIGNVLTSFAVETGNINDQAVTAPKLSATGGTDGQVLALDSNLNLEWVSDPAGQWVTSGTNLTYSEGDVGIGVASPTSILDVRDNQDGAAAEIKLFNLDQGNTTTQTAALVMTPDVRANGAEISVVKENADFSSSANKDVAITFAPVSNNTATEQIRIDSSGRMLVGSSTARSNFFNSTFSAGLQLEGTGTGRRAAIIGANGNASIILARQESGAVGGNTAPSNGHLIGSVSYQANDGAQFVVTADISAELDGNPGSNDMPGRLKFSTTADGAASPTERMRIDSSGRVLVGTNSNRSDSGLQVEGTTFATSRLSLAQNSTTGNAGATLKLIKSRGTSNGSFTSVIDDDRIGNVQFSGADGTGEITAATIEAFVDGTPGTNDMPGRLVFSTTTDGASIPTERLRIDSSGRLMVGTTSSIAVAGAETALQVEGTTADTSRISVINRGNNTGGGGIQIAKSRGTQPALVQDDDQVGGIFFAAGDANDFVSQPAKIECFIDGAPSGSDTPGRLTFSTCPDQTDTPVERLRIDSSGRVLVGTTSNTSPGAFSAKIQTASTSFDGSISLRRDSNNTGAQSLVFGKSRSSSLNGNTIVQSGDTLGAVVFCGADGTDLNSAAAQILGAVDGTPGSNDMPGRLVFQTTADGAVSPTERMRIDSSGHLLIGTLSSRATHGSGEARLQIEGTNTATAGVSVTRTDNGTGAATFSFGKTRNGSVVQSGDNLGTIHWQADDGTDLATPACSISAFSDGTPGSNDMPGRLTFSTTADGGASPTERMRIDSSGRLLVGTTSLIDSSTASNFQIASSSGPRLCIARNNTNVTGGNLMGALDFFGNDSNGTYEQCARIIVEADGTHGTGDKPTRLALYTTADGASSATERMRIDSSGRVGVGTTSPGSKLHIEDTMQATANGHNQITITGDDSGTNGESARIFLSAMNATNRGCGILAERQSSANDHDLILQTNSGGNTPSERMRIDSSGNVGINISNPTQQLHVDCGAPSSSDKIIGLFQSESSRQIYLGWDDSQSTMVLGTLTDHALAIHTSGQNTERIRIDANGLKFNGDTAAANALDDYEEGDWVPAAFNGANGASTTSVTSREARYVKVGGLVHISCYITIAKGTNTSQSFEIYGLPFTVGAAHGLHAGINVGYISGFNTSVSMVQATAQPGSSRLLIRALTGTSATISSTLDANSLNSSMEIILGGTYYTTQ